MRNLYVPANNSPADFHHSGGDVLRLYIRKSGATALEQQWQGLVSFLCHNLLTQQQAEVMVFAPITACIIPHSKY
ncbi:hypothetical protein QF020_000756 [Pseudomonas frederiksbergensis]|jgi:hypothetical protein|uniref:hypothetical protein n=1 Tax=Pseudomonas frederiksbergensis TaxID=104087 RepID=UPI003D244D26